MGPVMPVRGFQGAGPLRRGWGMHWLITVRAWASSPLARCTPSRLSECRAERLHRWRIVAGNVEAVGIVKNVWVAVGGGGVDNDLSQLTCRGATHCDTETLLHRGPR